MKWLLKLLIGLLLIIGILAFSLFSTAPITQNNTTLSPQEVSFAKTSLQRIVSELRSTSSTINLHLNQQELDALSNLAAHTFNYASFENYLSNAFFTSAVSVELPISAYTFNKKLYLNIYCSMSQFGEHFDIEECKVGKIPIPKSISKALIDKALVKSLSAETAAFIWQLFHKINILPSELVINSNRPPLLVAKVKASLSTIKQKATDFAVGKKLSLPTFMAYISLFEQHSHSNLDLANYIGLAFELAQQRSNLHPEKGYVSENRHALWALASYFGNRRFAKIAGLNVPENVFRSQTPSIYNRHDLSLHFLYSAILEQLGGEQFGLNIGEIKELDDSNEGGSGYSFPDLAADKAGLSFSRFIVKDRKSAQYAQLMLAGINEESVFFPSIESLPEGLSADEFKSKLGNTKSQSYKDIERIIDERIKRLPLYQ